MLSSNAYREYALNIMAYGKANSVVIVRVATFQTTRDSLTFPVGQERFIDIPFNACLLYTSDAADE